MSINTNLGGMSRRSHARNLISVVFAVLALAPVASASDWHDNTLDAAASSIAGHTVPVYCEDSWIEWYNVFRADQNVAGFTNPSRSPWIYVSPSQCSSLHALVNHEDVGTFYAATSLLTLAHEAVHQRGGEFANCTSANSGCEGRTECAAIPLVPTLVTQFFGIPPTVTEQYTVPVIKKRKVGKRVIRYTTTVVRYRSVSNPWLARLATDVQRWHQIKPDVYRAFC